jgi:hypothetical protein
MDPILNGLNPEWTQPRKDSTANGLDPEWTQPRMDSTPKGLNPDWDSTPNGPSPERDSTWIISQIRMAQFLLQPFSLYMKQYTKLHKNGI